MNKITKEFLESEIISVEYNRLQGTLTHCAITVKSGFVFTGESACVDPDNFDPELGEKFAYEQALDQMWMPYGFWLHKALADHDNRLQPPSDDNKIEATEAYADIKAELASPIGADEILQVANEAIVQRGVMYDSTGQQQERSMGKVVAMFNALTGHELTNEQGWKFMCLLKLARSEQGEFSLDSFIDLAAYTALAGEEAAKCNQQ